MVINVMLIKKSVLALAFLAKKKKTTKNKNKNIMVVNLIRLLRS